MKDLGVDACECEKKCTAGLSDINECVAFMARTHEMICKDCPTCKAGRWHKDGICCGCGKKRMNNIDSKEDDKNPTLRCIGWGLIVLPFIIAGALICLICWLFK